MDRQQVTLNFDADIWMQSSLYSAAGSRLEDDGEIFNIDVDIIESCSIQKSSLE